MNAASRHRLYSFFSRLFVREVDDALAEVLEGDFAKALLPAFAEAGPAPRVDLDADFVNLTVVSLVPYESFFRREDAMVESGRANPLADFLTRWGFEADLSAARSLSMDHVGIELELMAVLAQKEAEAAATGAAAYAAKVRAIERSFLEEHLLRWAPVYFLAAARNAKTALYRDGADAALQFLLSDHEGLVKEGA
ncbi:MAG: molecular chaperone TorD family protein [Myxococcales bacterium]|nr:molecular chaperone TorD family protein [Myxococcales bacterium]